MLYSRFKAQRMADLFNEPYGDLRIPGLLKLINWTMPKRVLEIGSYMGVSTEVFLLHCHSVVAVDPWPDLAVYFQYGTRCASYPGLTTIRGKSPGAIENWEPGSFDLAYIDGDHSLEAVYRDIEVCKTLVRTGGWIAGHDYGGKDTPGVKEAVDLKLGEKNVVIFPDSSFAVLNV